MNESLRVFVVATGDKKIVDEYNQQFSEQAGITFISLDDFEQKHYVSLIIEPTELGNNALERAEIRAQAYLNLIIDRGLSNAVTGVIAEENGFISPVVTEGAVEVDDEISTIGLLAIGVATLVSSPDPETKPSVKLNAIEGRNRPELIRRLRHVFIGIRLQF